MVPSARFRSAVEWATITGEKKRVATESSHPRRRPSYANSIFFGGGGRLRKFPKCRWWFRSLGQHRCFSRERGEVVQRPGNQLLDSVAPGLLPPAEHGEWVTHAHEVQPREERKENLVLSLHWPQFLSPLDILHPALRFITFEATPVVAAKFPSVRQTARQLRHLRKQQQQQGPTFRLGNAHSHGFMGNVVKTVAFPSRATVEFCVFYVQKVIDHITVSHSVFSNEKIKHHHK
ncbi:unnamed protein product [Pleuronectes platessa]|uniref:Uncharacterized protein n=1 Tax=Pleuronectes platessa TaxID=8262 RepID=A0A9N7VWX8_PLEPL|nr:unnamed protein product [Pleuronectes platessa]